MQINETEVLKSTMETDQNTVSVEHSFKCNTNFFCQEKIYSSSSKDKGEDKDDSLGESKANESLFENAKHVKSKSMHDASDIKRSSNQNSNSKNIVNPDLDSLNQSAMCEFLSENVTDLSQLNSNNQQVNHFNCRDEDLPSNIEKPEPVNNNLLKHARYKSEGDILIEIKKENNSVLKLSERIMKIDNKEQMKQVLSLLLLQNPKLFYD